MDWKKLLAYISGSVDEELLLRNEYLVTENRILRAQIKDRLKLTDGERKTLAEIGKKLGRKVLEEVASIVKRLCCITLGENSCPPHRSPLHPTQYASGIPKSVILLRISQPTRCSTRCLANVRALISGPMIAL